MTKLEEWKYTAEQAQAIQNHDVDAMTKFYYDNYERLKIMAQCFVRKRRLMGFYQYEVEDVLSQVYIDLPYCTYNSLQEITYFFKKISFGSSIFGGLTYSDGKRRYVNYKKYRLSTISTDEILNDDYNVSFIDRFFSQRSAYDEIEQQDRIDFTEDIRKILAKYLTQSQVDFLILLCEGYSTPEAIKKMGKKKNFINKMQVVANLHKNVQYKELVRDLIEIGCEGAVKYLNINPISQYEKRREYKKQYFSNPENRKKRREYDKKYFSNPENRKKRREYDKKYFSNPENRKKRSEYCKQYREKKKLERQQKEQNSVLCIV